MEVSIVTLTWNSEDYIEQMLGSLINKLRGEGIEYEIFVIDNGSTDKTLEILKRIQKSEKRLFYIPLCKNLGTTFSRNIGLKLCTKEYVLIVDSDTDFSETSFVELINSFNEINSERIGVVHPQLVHPTGEVQNSALKFPNFKNKLKRFLGKEDVYYDLNKIQKIDYGISAAWLLRKKIFDEIGYLDEKIFYAPEDAEYCKRLWENNYEVWYYPKVKIIHYYQRLTKKKKFTKLWFLYKLK
ncbi:glycosyltransferase family 2 protein [Geobacillus stearothermophilus]|uniref:glycosyltransferase family 2 protein n=1 Tax=Geobacillus stearothermophilus TaxID=1422 RepID=UPI002E20CB8E|nr:glycosyltransferase [Geobacillus stearothermophilus]MED3752083.1 glycosyltransferase [Geobacillus stearothermophilus]